MNWFLKVISTCTLTGTCLWCNPASAQVLPATVSVSQWRDSFLAKWQAGNDADKTDSITQLAALLLLIANNDPQSTPLIERLEMQADVSPEAQMALAFHSLNSGLAQNASKRLLDLILRYPDDQRIPRFRIALARSFHLDGQLDMASAQIDPLINFETDSGQYAAIEKALIYIDLHENEKAVELLEKLLQISEESDYIHTLTQQYAASLQANQVLVEGVEIE